MKRKGFTPRWKAIAMARGPPEKLPHKVRLAMLSLLPLYILTPYRIDGCLRGMLDDFPVRRVTVALATARLVLALFKSIDKVSSVLDLGRLSPLRIICRSL